VLAAATAPALHHRQMAEPDCQTREQREHQRVDDDGDQRGGHVVYGDATREEVLAAALPQAARLIVVALPDAFQARRVISLARTLNPKIETAVRTHSDAEAHYLADLGVGLAVMGEREIAFGMSDFALQRLGVSAEDAQETVNRLRARKRPVASAA